MTKHTPEPWVSSPRTDDCLHSKNGGEVVRFYGHRYKANKRRVEACLAACAGIPTEQLEAGAIEKLIEGLGLIAAKDGMTLLGSHPDPELSHQTGAAKAFSQCADTAFDALAALAPFQKD